MISLHRSGVINGTPQDDAVAAYTAIGLRGVCTEFLVTSATSFTGLCSSAAQSVVRLPLTATWDSPVVGYSWQKSIPAVAPKI